LALSLHTRAVLGLLLANLFWGLSFPLIKGLLLLQVQLLAPGTPGWFQTALALFPRFLLATLLLVAWQWVRVRRFDFTRGEWKQGVILGLFSSGGMLLQSDGLHYTAASTSAFLTQLYAILIPLYVAWRTRRNPGLAVWASAGLVLVGVGILGQFNVQTFSFGRGEVETLLASLFFMGQILWLDRSEYAANRAVPLTLIMFGTEAVIFLGAAWTVAPGQSLEAVFAGLGTFTQSGAWWGLTGTLTLLCTLGAFSLMNIWQPKMPATQAGLLYCVEPIFGSIKALFLPAWLSVWTGITYANEQPTWTLLVGGGLITVANVWVQLASRPR
jgi:drug/metabolite transporter (DMT)-like permease